MITDGQSRWPPQTAMAAQLVRDEGTTMAAIGIADADEDELLAIAGQQDLVYYVDSFDDLERLVGNITYITCRIVIEWEIIQSKLVTTICIVITLQTTNILETVIISCDK